MKTDGIDGIALKEGRRLFTREDLLNYSKRALAESDKPLQVEGGLNKCDSNN